MTLAERLRDGLAREGGTAMLAGDHPDLSALATVTPAAVLVAVTNRAEPGVILTERAAGLRRHAGQIAFPGGRIDAGEDAVAAALREAEEEVAIPRDAVEVIGIADRYRTVSAYEVTPVIGVVPPDLRLVASEAEVASVFEAPLAFLLDRANHRQATRDWQGRERHYYEIIWGDRRIWGATAAMIVNLARRLEWS